MQKSILLRALQQEIRRHDFNYFIHEPPTIAQGRERCGRASLSPPFLIVLQRGYRRHKKKVTAERN